MERGDISSASAPGPEAMQRQLGTRSTRPHGAKYQDDPASSAAAEALNGQQAAVQQGLGNSQTAGSGKSTVTQPTAASPAGPRSAAPSPPITISHPPMTTHELRRPAPQQQPTAGSAAKPSRGGPANNLPAASGGDGCGGSKRSGELAPVNQLRNGAGAASAPPGVGRAPAQPVKRLGPPLQAIAVRCSPPPPELLAAKRLRDGAASKSNPRAAKRSRDCSVSPGGSRSTDDMNAPPACNRDGSGAGSGGRLAGTIYGVFHPDRYLSGERCIDYQGNFITRSKFEKLGGSLMAKWYRSIRVVTTDEPLGSWLARRGLPVLKGNPRNRKSSEMDAENCGSGSDGGGGAPRPKSGAVTKFSTGPGGLVPTRGIDTHGPGSNEAAADDDATAAALRRWRPPSRLRSSPSNNFPEERLPKGGGTSAVMAAAAAEPASAVAVVAGFPPSSLRMSNPSEAPVPPLESLRQGSSPRSVAELTAGSLTPFPGAQLPSPPTAQLHLQLDKSGAWVEEMRVNQGTSENGGAKEGGGAAAAAALGAARRLGLCSSGACAANRLGLSDLQTAQLQQRVSNSSSSSCNSRGGTGRCGVPPDVAGEDGPGSGSAAGATAMAATTSSRQHGHAISLTMSCPQHQHTLQPQQQMQQMPYTQDDASTWSLLSCPPRVLPSPQARHSGGAPRPSCVGQSGLLSNEIQPVLSGALTEQRSALLLSRGGGQAAAAQPSRPAQLNRIEMVKLELLRGAYGSGGATATTATAAAAASTTGLGPVEDVRSAQSSLLLSRPQPHSPLPQPVQSEVLPLRRAWADTFESRVQQLLCGGGRGQRLEGAAAAAGCVGGPGVESLGSPSSRLGPDLASSQAWLGAGGAGGAALQPAWPAGTAA